MNIFSKDKDGQLKIKIEAFASKTALLNGVEKSLYKRIMGKKFAVIADDVTNCDYTMTFNNAKVESLEIINGALGDSLTFQILDKAVNPIYGTANAILNEFGNDVYMDVSGYYEQHSQYDADMVKDLQFRVIFSNSGAAKDIYINYVLNEIK